MVKHTAVDVPTVSERNMNHPRPLCHSISMSTYCASVYCQYITRSVFLQCSVHPVMLFVCSTMTGARACMKNAQNEITQLGRENPPTDRSRPAAVRLALRS